MGWSGPVVSGDILYLGTMEGKVLALDLADNHAQEWVYPPGDDKLGGIYGKPVVAVGEDEELVVYIGTFDGRVYALYTDGRRKWDTSLGSSIVGSPAVAVALDTVFVGTSEGILYALRIDNGNILWKYPAEGNLGDEIWSSLVVEVVDDAGVVYFGCFDHKFRALDAVSGELKWEFETQGAIGSTPLVYGDTVYFGSFDQRFYAIYKDTGEQKWAFKANNWFWTEAIVSDGIIYVGSLDHNFYAIDAADGGEIWRYQTGGLIRSSPALVDGLVVFGSEDGKVYALYADETGGLARSYSLGVPIRAPVCAQNSTIYVYGSDSTLYALDIGGAELWSINTKE